MMASTICTSGPTSCWQRFSCRHEGAFARPTKSCGGGAASVFRVLGVGAGLELGEDGGVGGGRMVLGGVAPAPIEVSRAAQGLVGGRLDREQIVAAAEACYLKARPLDNTDFAMNWRKQMARPFVSRALERIQTSL